MSPYADIFITSENEGTNYLTNYPTPTSNSENDPSNQNRIFHIVTNVNSTDLAAVVAKTRAQNAGWVYITDDVLPNPYDVLSNYFDTFVGQVATLPASIVPQMPMAATPDGCMSATVSQGVLSENSHEISVANSAS